MENAIWKSRSGLLLRCHCFWFCSRQICPSVSVLVGHEFTLIPPVSIPHHREGILPRPPPSIAVSLFCNSEKPDSQHRQYISHQYISHRLDFYSTEKVFSELLHLVPLWKTNLQSRVCFLLIFFFFKESMHVEKTPRSKKLRVKGESPFTPDSQFLCASLPSHPCPQSLRCPCRQHLCAHVGGMCVCPLPLFKHRG